VDVAKEPANPPRRGSASLAREIGLIGLLWASMGSIIGSGWLFGAQRGLIHAGPAAIISWVIGGICILILALVHAELGAMYPLSGGSARFPHYAFGGIAGAGFGWFSWLQAVTVAPIEVSAMILYLTHYHFARNWLHADQTLTHTGLIVAVVIMAILASVNYLGVKVLANTNSVLTWWKVGIPVATIVIVLIHGAADGGLHTSNFHAGGGFSPGGLTAILIAIPASSIVFSYLGFEQADQLAGESKNPKRDIPVAVIGSILLGLVIYIALQVVFLLALPHNLVPGNWTASNSPLAGLTGPWAQLATAIGIGWLASVLYADAVISPGGTGLIYTAAGARVSYGLARNNYFHSAFERLNVAKVPWFGVIVSFVAGCICFLPFPSWQSLIGLITSASVLMYAGAPLSFGAFRRRLPDAERPFRLPLGGVFSPLAFVVATWIIMWTGWVTDYKLGILIVLGSLVIFNREMRPEFMNWKSASWLPVYLIGVGLITYFSIFRDPEPKSHEMSLWWSLGVCGVFALAIYYWAINVALPATVIQKMVDEVVVPEEEDLAVPAH